MRNIEYEKIIENLNTLINTLEFDCMRSAGKVKMNADVLNNAYELKAKYEKMIKPAKPTPVKKEG